GAGAGRPRGATGSIGFADLATRPRGTSLPRAGHRRPSSCRFHTALESFTPHFTPPARSGHARVPIVGPWTLDPRRTGRGPPAESKDPLREGPMTTSPAQLTNADALAGSRSPRDPCGIRRRVAPAVSATTAVLLWSGLVSPAGA